MKRSRDSLEQEKLEPLPDRSALSVLNRRHPPPPPPRGHNGTQNEMFNTPCPTLVILFNFKLRQYGNLRIVSHAQITQLPQLP